MDELTPMKTVNCTSVFKSGNSKFPSVLLASAADDSYSEVLIEYRCDYDAPIFIRWSACLDLDRNWFKNKCSICREDRKNCRAFDVCAFEQNPFASADGKENIFRDNGIITVCRECYGEAEDVFEKAAKDNSEFVAFNL